MLPHMAFSAHDWQRDCCIAVATVALVILSMRVKGKLKQAVIMSCVFLGAANQLQVAGAALCVQPAFNYPDTPIMATLRSAQQRIVATGTHLLRPDTNIMYQVSDLRTHNPLFPARFLEFMKASGAQLDNFNQFFMSAPNALANLASTRLIVSQLPLKEDDDPATKEASGSSDIDRAKHPSKFSSDANMADRTNRRRPPGFLPAWTGLKLLEFELTPDKNGNAAFGTIRWLVSPQYPDYGYTLGLCDRRNQVLWFSDLEPIVPGTSSNRKSCTMPIFEHDLSIPIPLFARSGDTLQLKLKVFDRKKMRFVGMENDKSGDSTCTVASLQVNRPPASHKGALDLTGEYDNHVRLYLNNRALPNAYIVHSAQLAAGKEECMRLICSAAFRPGRQVVLEHEDIDCIPGLLFSRRDIAPHTESAIVHRLSNNMVRVDADLALPGLLVLTDTYYPGWRATIDGKPVPLVHANYLFKAVPVAEGKHQVTFVYFPDSFRWGAVLALSCLMVLSVFSCASALACFLKRRRTSV